ncbi:uncharacterized protein LOC116290179 [Actinia tenebrosa]|uniref:Uncharacterized protein LOC116290179 n=1 Tax=Actinia tenebrosa TaxID=6105 RepID=A0A6P8HKB7_ACTTE|nr:uncharacterized protein LOC116290179 [Actinia tenebrosa]
MTEKKGILILLSLWTLLVFKGSKGFSFDTKVHCNPRSMVLIVKSSSNQSLQLSLMNSSCKAVKINNTHVLFQTPLTACGTQYKLSDERVVFFNWLIIKKSDQSQRIQTSRVIERSVPFHCVYKKKDVAEIMKVFEPLNFDPSRSSPQELFSLLGLPVKIQCTFRSGATPVTVKFFKNQTMVAMATNQSILTEIVMARKRDFGEYTCIAIDRNGKTAMHNITIKHLDHAAVPRDGVYTTCSESSFHVIMNRTLYPWLQPALKHLHLRDHSCEPWHINNTHIILNSSYDQCKTFRKESYREVIYDNVFIVHVKPRDDVPVLDVPDIEFAIECRLRRKPLSRITVMPSVQGKVYYLNGQLFGIFHHGSTVRAVCQTDPHEKFVAWKVKNGRQPLTRSKEKALNKMLLVENVTDSNGGVYVCVTTRRHLTLHFFVKAHFYAKSKQYIRKGRDGAVVCSAGGFPEVTKSWTKNGIKIDMKGRFSIDKKGNLMIAEARKEDSGLYACEVEQVFEVPLRMRAFQEINIMVEIYDPLVIDRFMTSRKQINTYEGLKTNIICSFKHGATPISITLSKNGQNIESVVKVRGRTLYALLQTNSGSFGKYVCVAKDAVGKKIHYVMNLRKIGKKDSLINGIGLNCYKDYMDVTFNLLEFPFLDTNNYHIHLNSSECEPYEFTNTYLRIQVPLSGCGTTVKQHGQVASYYNSLIVRLAKEKWRNKLINRVPDLVFPFQCAYKKTIVEERSIQVPIDSLKVNALHSSPLYVTSLLNIRLRLTCSFIGGVQPLKMNMIKDGKQVVEAEKVDENTLTTVVWAGFSAVGSYECNAVDETGQKGKHKITLGLTDWKKVPKTRGISIQCDSNSISISLDRHVHTWIHPEFLTIHLADERCKPSFIDSSHMLIATPLNSCGTLYKETDDHVVYRNKLILSERVEVFRVITWSPVVAFPIECRYKRKVGGSLITVEHA